MEVDRTLWRIRAQGGDRQGALGNRIGFGIEAEVGALRSCMIANRFDFAETSACRQPGQPFSSLKERRAIGRKPSGDDQQAAHRHQIVASRAELSVSPEFRKGREQIGGAGPSNKLTDHQKPSPPYPNIRAIITHHIGSSYIGPALAAGPFYLCWELKAACL